MKSLKSFALAIFAFSAITVSAQTQGSPEEQAAVMNQVMQDELNLTSNQAEEIGELNLKVAEKIQAVNESQTLSPERKVEFVAGNMQDKRTVLSTLLTPAQLARYDELIADGTLSAQ